MIAEEEAEEAGAGDSSEGGAGGSSGAGVGGGGTGGAARGGGGGGSGGRRPLTRREIEEVTVQACLVPVSGVPRVDQVCKYPPTFPSPPPRVLPFFLSKATFEAASRRRECLVSLNGMQAVRAARARC